MNRIRTAFLSCLFAFCLVFQSCADATPGSTPEKEFPEFGEYILRYKVCYRDGYCHQGELNKKFWKLTECQEYGDKDLAEAINAYSVRRGGLKEGWLQCGLVQHEGVDI